MTLDTIYNEDCLEGMRQIEDGTIDLIVTDPPYNIGKEKELGKTWDIIDNYQEWMLDVFKECERVLKPNGVLYFFHNDIPQMFRLMNNLEDNTSFFFNSFCVWYKEGWRANSYSQTGREDANYVLRQWFNVCEYFAEYWKMGEIETDNKTGLKTILGCTDLFPSIRQWLADEFKRLGIRKSDVDKLARERLKMTGIFNSCFRDSNFTIPTKEEWDACFEPLGFRKEYNGTTGYDALRLEYEALRLEYEALRPYHLQDQNHCNVFTNQQPMGERLHTCQKPVDMIRRLVLTSSRKDETILDPFMGSGTTAIACIKERRHFIGFELSKEYFDKAVRRIKAEQAQLTLF